MTRFRCRRSPIEFILLRVRLYCKDGISYRNLTELMQERGFRVDPTMILRRVHHYAPEPEYQGYGSISWLVDETYVKVDGSWKYLFPGS